MKLLHRILCLPALLLSCPVARAADAPIKWEPCGWGGGGFYYAAAYHPTQKGVIYMGGDVAGVYKTEDNGRTWRLINNGLVDYGVFSLAVDRTNPQTVYAATEGGLCKSLDAGEHWKLLPMTKHKELRITGEKGKSIRAIAVDPADGHNVYAASPAGKAFKSTDGGETWKEIYAKSSGAEDASFLRVQLGKVNGDFFGGAWLPLTFPAAAKGKDCVGLGFTFKGDKSHPDKAFVSVQTADGATFRTKNMRDLFATDQVQEVLLKTTDFELDADYAKKNPEKAKALTGGPDWAAVNRIDFSAVGALPNEASVARIGKISFAFAPGTGGSAGKPTLIVVREFTSDKTARTYGNVRVGGGESAGAYHSVAISPKEPLLVLVATDDSGLVMSPDGGKSWKELPTPKRASSASVSATDPKTIYGSFYGDGVWKSTDRGQTWTDASAGLPKGMSITEVVVSPVNPLDVYAIGAVGWNGGFYFSNDGAKTWTKSSTIIADTEGDPTYVDGTGGKTALSTPTNLTINPLNPKELFCSNNWRPCLSEDGGLTWKERCHGADISCITDIRFSGPRTYVSVMDEGTFVTEDSGRNWRQLWPPKYLPEFIGHNWRLAIDNLKGVDRVIATCSPWDTKYPPRVVRSDDAGKTYQIIKAGLPETILRANTMWGVGHPRALAVDPKNTDIVYLGIDGDPENGKGGGGIFKSLDGGVTWAALPNQPASRRMFYGLAVDPTDSQRIYWAACGANGGLHRSENGGATWKSVFPQDQWVFNMMVAADGTVYCGGKNLWRSTDHGNTWKQLTKFTTDRTVLGIEVDPRNAATMWISMTTWDGSNNGAVYKTSDSGVTWQDITGNLPYVKPLIIRFNPTTNELWAGGVTLQKLKQ
ncbi:MAG: hypothetical protein QOE70_2997 [Chthoniobacter sp.]|nr:hypothetical protein [Chthoniobacter sp.]